MNIYERLVKDHERQRALTDEIMNTSGDSPERRALWNALKKEIEAHAAAEEQTFYAALIEKPNGQAKARHSVAEHKETADLVDELDRLDMGSGGWLQKFEKLKDGLIHHVDEEEQEVFEQAQKIIKDDRAERMTARFEQRKTAEL
jgi:iron-sulfur cluster repair protein YtfE (RIC family)